MGYTGKAVGSYWTWRPTASSVGDTYQTLVTEFEAGTEQRRAKWDRPRAQIRLQYERSVLTFDDLADMWRFYQAKRGSLTPFEVPTWGRLTTVASTYPGSGTLLGLSDTQDLCTSAGSRWNRIFVEQAAGTYEVFTVSSVVDGTTTRVVTGSTSGTVFAAGDQVYPVVKVRFTGPVLAFEYRAPMLGTVTVEFTEVHS